MLNLKPPRHTPTLRIGAVDCVVSARLNPSSAEFLQEVFAEVGAPPRTAENIGERLKCSS
jgi:hypothetical protein